MEASKKNRRCPRCASKDVLLEETFDDGADLYVCIACDHEFEVYVTRGKQREVPLDFDDDIELDSSEEDWGGMYPA